MNFTFTLLYFSCFTCHHSFNNIYQWNRMTQLSNLIIKATPSSIFVEERIFFKSINLKPITKTKKGKKKNNFPHRWFSSNISSSWWSTGLFLYARLVWLVPSINEDRTTCKLIHSFTSWLQIKEHVNQIS